MRFFATEGVTLSGIPQGMGLSADSTLEKPIKLGAEGASAFVRQSLRQKDKVRYIFCFLISEYRNLLFKSERRERFPAYFILILIV